MYDTYGVELTKKRQLSSFFISTSLRLFPTPLRMKHFHSMLCLFCWVSHLSKGFQWLPSTMRKMVGLSSNPRFLDDYPTSSVIDSMPEIVEEESLTGVSITPPVNYFDLKLKVIQDLFPSESKLLVDSDYSPSIDHKEDSHAFGDSPSLPTNILPQRTLECLDVLQLLEILQNETKTVLGREAILHAEHKSVEEIQAEYVMIDQIRHHLEYLPFASSFNVWKLLNSVIFNLGPAPKAAFGNFSFDLDHVYEIQHYLLEHTQSLSMFHPLAINNLTLPKEVFETFNKSFVGDFRLNPEKYPSLGRIYKQINSLEAQIRERMEQIATSPSMKDKLVSNGYMESKGRYLLMVKRAGRRGLGVVHSRSQSGKTLLIEPFEVIDQTNQLMDLYEELRDEENEILNNMTRIIRLYQKELLDIFTAITKIDILKAKASVGEKLEGVIPEVANEGHIYCANAKHPLLLLRSDQSPTSQPRKRKKNVVGNTIELNENSTALVISGPNAGGKTIVLKTCGLFAFMVRYSIPIPAQSGARFDVFHDIMADIGDIQSVLSDLSTFSGHLLVCREIIDRTKASAEENELTALEAAIAAGQNTADIDFHKPGKYSLILMDEIGTGTDPLQGAALAQSILEELTAHHHTRLIVTTHYNRIKELASTRHNQHEQVPHKRKRQSYQIAAMEFIQNKPTYRLKLGSVGESHALELAKRMNLPETVLIRAYNLLDDETKRLVQLQSRLQEETEKMYILQQQYQNKFEELQQREINIQNITDRLQGQIQRIREGKLQEFYLDLTEKQSKLALSLEQIRQYETELSKKMEKLRYYEQKEREGAFNEASQQSSSLSSPSSFAASSSVSSPPDPPIRSQDLLFKEVQAKLQETKEETAEELVRKSLQKFNANPLEIGQPLEQGERIIVIEPGIYYGKTGTVTRRNKGTGRVLIRIDALGQELKIDRQLLCLPKPISELKKQNYDQLSAKERKLLKLIEEEVVDVPELMSSSALKRRKRALEEASSSSSDASGKDPSGNSRNNDVNVLDVRKIGRFDELITALDDFITKQLDLQSSNTANKSGKKGKHSVTVRVQHGINHPLKGRFRNWLETNDLISDCYSAPLSEGGDAFTIVEVTL